MRKAFVRQLLEIARADPRIVLLTADLGYTVIEPFTEALPERSFNVGVAEQNMIGVATGLAESGFLPFCYSIATFASLRPLEFFRNGAVLHGLPVRVVGVGGGFEYGLAGPTHYGLEDIGVLRTLPGLTLVAPADSRQTATALQETWDLPNPVYYRLGKDDTREVSGLDGRFHLGGFEIVREGRDVAILTMGAVARDASRACEKLEETSVSALLAVVSCLGPGAPEGLADTLRNFPVAVTYEAHHPVGGLGSLVAEVIAEAGLGCRLVRCAPKNAFALERLGREPWMQHATGFSCEQLVELVQTSLRDRHRA